VAVVVGGVVVLHDPVEVVLSWRLISNDKLNKKRFKNIFTVVIILIIWFRRHYYDSSIQKLIMM